MPNIEISITGSLVFPSEPTKIVIDFIPDTYTAQNVIRGPELSNFISEMEKKIISAILKGIQSGPCY